jgi:hypothetical protein
MKRYFVWAVLAVVAVSALALVVHRMPSSDEKFMAQDQEVIDGCWQEAKGTSLTPAQEQRTITACQKLEEVYRSNWGADPLPQATDV